MRLIKITGGLGNQMFIYAFYLQMRKRFNSVFIDLSDMVHYNVHYGYEINRVFNLPHTEFCMNQKIKKILEFLFFKTILERKQKGRMEPYTKKYIWPLIYFKGFYQTEKYFADIKDEVRKAFTFNMSLASAKSKKTALEMDQNEHSVSIHIRRGDYLQPKHWEAIGQICQLEYYQNAIKEIEKHIENPVYYVFSEDLKWVKENLNLKNAVYIDWNKGDNSWQDMMLMSHCHHHIICNSTFSWWGAWLDSRKKKIVIGPQQWTKHENSDTILPQEWIKVPCK